MTSPKEVLFATLRHEETDALPWVPFAGVHAGKLVGYHATEVLSEADKLFESLMAENQRRVQHLDQAGHHLEQRMEELGKRRNMLRQEEIIEEIEVILLSAASLEGRPGQEART